MREIVNEDIRLIHIGPDTELTLAAINYALLRASANYMYAKFYTDKWFIQVNFMRDRTIAVSSNIRIPEFSRDMWKYDQQGWTIPLVKQFIYKWMQQCRGKLG